MDAATKAYLLRLARNDRAQAQDNRVRAESAARHHDATKQWGSSGKTLQALIDEYREWESVALVAINSLEREG